LLVADRHDSKWDYLRDDQLLAQRVGHFIELPDLPGDKPKQLVSEHWQKFLLTKQRLEIANELIGAIGHGPLKERSSNGLCLSGPQGVGKSALNYLLASIAYARGWYLQYLPLCGVWAGCTTDALRADYFIRQYKCLNDDLSVLGSVATSDLAMQDKVLYHMQTTTEKPALILLDEHNELYRLREREDGRILQYKNLAYFGRFTTWTGLSGPRIYIIYSGSAHSAFEANLPSGEKTKLRFLCPFDESEAVKLIEELQIPKKFPNQYSSREISIISLVEYHDIFPYSRIPRIRSPSGRPIWS